MMATTPHLEHSERPLQVLLETPRGKTAAVTLDLDSLLDYDDLVCQLALAARDRDVGPVDEEDYFAISNQQRTLLSSCQDILVIKDGRFLERGNFCHWKDQLCYSSEDEESDFSHNIPTFQLKVRGKGGMDRQNRVGSKFGGGGVSSAQQSERERKERLKRLALESIDLAKDPYLMRNHLGTYECKLCLTLHTNEANYLAHTQ